MTRHVALLRAINVAGQRSVGMSDLRAFMSALGFADVQTLLQSGNVVFNGGRASAARLETTFEREARTRLSLDTDFFVRTADEWKAIVSRNPFPREAERDPGHLIVVFLRKECPAANAKALQAAIVGPETMRLIGSQLYVVYPDGMGRSRLTNALIEKKLGARGTARNWNTVLKLHALVSA